ncbi:TRAP transporter substrate-binding protein DctP [Agromyces bauzanensis]
MIGSRNTRLLAIAATAAATLALAGCGGGGDGTDDGTSAGEENPQIDLTLANSYTDDHAHSRCGALVIAEELNGMDIGLNVEVFTNSQLGADADRFASLIDGDLDMDMQGVSAMSASYAPIGVLGSAFAFSDADHLFRYFDGEESQPLKDAVLEEIGVRILDPYYFGYRTFSANSPIRSPEDLEGLRIRFPDTPIHLANAEALGATAVPIAFEELFIALQQGTADGQENPIPTIKSLSLDEVQSHVSLDNHLTDFQLVIINEEKWQQMSAEQQEAVTEVVHEVRAEDRQCIEDDTQAIIDEWNETGAVEVVDDVDRDAFEERAVEYFSDYYSGADLELFEAIRDTAD